MLNVSLPYEIQIYIYFKGFIYISRVHFLVSVGIVVNNSRYSSRLPSYTHTNSYFPTHRTSDCEENALLPLGTSLKQKNYAGGTRNNPEKVLMFYTYITELRFTNNHPILEQYSLVVRSFYKDNRHI